MVLTLLTCNIRFDNPADGDNSWIHRRDFLAQTLLKHKPDVIATQEGRFAQLKDLESLLPDYLILDHHRSWIKERMYPTLFVHKDKFEIKKSGDIWLSETPDVAGSCSFDSTFPRLMTWSKLQLRHTHKNILVVNTHLDHIKRETRVCQAGVLVSEIKKLSSPQEHLAIMGDFNDSPDSEVRIIFQKEFEGIQDAWATKNSKEETSYHSFKGEMPGGARIDWILLDKELHVESSMLEKASLNGRFPTDHFPVVCKISL